MATTVPIVFSLAPIPTGQSMDANQYGQMLIANLRASITANFLLGQTGGPEPSTNIGPWFNASDWWAWNDSESKYFPLASTAVYNSISDAQMQVWQRSTIFLNVDNGQGKFTADRWFASNQLVSGTATVQQGAVNLPGTDQYPNTQISLRVIVVTPQITIGASEIFEVYQRIERTFARPLFDKLTSFSIVLQSSVVGTYCVSIRNADLSWSYVMECNVTLPNQPQYFTFPSIPAMPTDTGDWGSLNTDACYSVTVCLTCGSDFQDLPNIWNASNQISTSNQQGFFDTANNTLDFTLVQHESSPVCNAFKYIPFDEDLRRCQRYYCLSYDYGAFPGSVTGIGSGIIAYASVNGAALGYVRYPQPMRSAPSFPTSLSLYSGSTGIGSRVYDNASALDRLVTSVPGSSKTGFSTIAATSLVGGTVAFFHYAASAEL